MDPVEAHIPVEVREKVAEALEADRGLWHLAEAVTMVA